MAPSNEKPEWFQMTEGDKIPRQRKIKRGIQVLAVTLPLLVLGGGFVVAQTQNNGNASASETVTLASTPAAAPQTTATSTENSATPAATATTSGNVRVVNADQRTSAAPKSRNEAEGAKPSSATTPTPSSAPSSTPSILPPTGGGGDDGLEGSGAIAPTTGSGSISQLPSGSHAGHEGGDHHRSKGVAPTIGNGSTPSIGQLPTGGNGQDD